MIGDPLPVPPDNRRLGMPAADQSRPPGKHCEGAGAVPERVAPPFAPANHPRVDGGRIGILISNLGTPDGYDYWSVRRYLAEFLSDRRVIDYPRWKWLPILNLVVLTVRPFTSGKAYRSIWDEDSDASPLMVITANQAQRLADLAQQVYGHDVEVAYCMRYGNPSIAAQVEHLLSKGCSRILFFPLYPQYSATTTATACDAFYRCLMQVKWQPTVRIVAPYFDHPSYIDRLADSVDSHLSGLDHKPDVLIASYHGLPKRYLLEGDPYHCHCRKTSRLLAERLGQEPGIVTTFQSRFGPEDWLQPYTVEEVARLAKSGHERIAVLAPGFAADCIETLEEINGEICEAFLEAGGKAFSYIPCLNDGPQHVDMLFELVRENLRGWACAD